MLLVTLHGICKTKRVFCLIGGGGYSASKINSFYYVFLLLSLDGSHELEQKTSTKLLSKLRVGSTKRKSQLEHHQDWKIRHHFICKQ